VGHRRCDVTLSGTHPQWHPPRRPDAGGAGSRQAHPAGAPHKETGIDLLRPRQTPPETRITPTCPANRNILTYCRGPHYLEEGGTGYILGENTATVPAYAATVAAKHQRSLDSRSVGRVVAVIPLLVEYSEDDHAGCAVGAFVMLGVIVGSLLLLRLATTRTRR
jgi:hypothetical protein